MAQVNITLDENDVQSILDSIDKQTQLLEELRDLLQTQKEETNHSLGYITRLIKNS